jgi:hypothetical protein
MVDDRIQHFLNPTQVIFALHGDAEPHIVPAATPIRREAIGD